MSEMDDQSIRDHFKRGEQKMDAILEAVTETQKSLTAVITSQSHHDRMICAIQSRCDARGAQCVSVEKRMYDLEGKVSGLKFWGTAIATAVTTAGVIVGAILGIKGK